MRYRVVCAALALISSACVSTGEYEAAVKSADDARAKLKHVVATDGEKMAELQRWLDEAKTESAELRAELARLGADTETLSAKKGNLASALGESKRRLEELRRAQAAAEARAKLYRELALKLKKMVDAGDLRIGLQTGKYSGEVK